MNILCGPRLYEYQGWTFEFGHCGPWPLKKDGELIKRAGRRFFQIVKKWEQDPYKEAFRIGGVCKVVGGAK